MHPGWLGALRCYFSIITAWANSDEKRSTSSRCNIQARICFNTSEYKFLYNKNQTSIVYSLSSVSYIKPDLRSKSPLAEIGGLKCKASQISLPAKRGSWIIIILLVLHWDASQFSVQTDLLDLWCRQYLDALNAGNELPVHTVWHDINKKLDWEWLNHWIGWS